MVSATEFIAFAGEWGPSGVVGLIFGWMIAAIVRDRRQSIPTAKTPTAQELIDKVMKATDAAADTKALREDAEEIKQGQAKIYDALLRLLAQLEARK